MKLDPVNVILGLLCGAWAVGLMVVSFGNIIAFLASSGFLVMSGFVFFKPTEESKVRNGQYWFFRGGETDYPCDETTEIWYKDGQIHRDNGPAIIRPNGNLEWYRNGLRQNPELTIRRTHQ